MKKEIRYLKYLLVLALSELLKTDSYISLYKNIMQVHQNTNYMILFSLLKISIVPFFITGMFIYFDIKFRRQKRNLKKYIDNTSEIHEKVNTMVWEVEKRKRQYLFDCIKSGQILEEGKYLNEFEESLLDDIFKKVVKENTKLKKQLSEGYKKEAN